MNGSILLDRDPTHAARPDPDASLREAASDEATPRKQDLERIVASVCKRIAPVWPLKHFVAVNPFLGQLDRRFPAACARVKRVTGADMLMPREFYRAAIAAGRITYADLAGAHVATPKDAEALEQALEKEPEPCRPAAATVADVLDAVSGRSTARFVTDEIAKWCAAYWDEGQAAWRMPWRDLQPYPAWRAAARHDRTPAIMGIARFQRTLASLPQDPLAAIAAVVGELHLPDRAVEPYLERAFASIGGWAAYARYRAWDKELAGTSDDTLAHLLAIRLAWDGALFAQHREGALRAAWAEAGEVMAGIDDESSEGSDLAPEMVLQEAYERGAQREILAALANAAAGKEPCVSQPKAVQAAFCIDVRSEAYRRALESVAPDVETLGFAGFFGFPIEYVPIGHLRGGAQCPVLLTPKFIVCETVQDAFETERQDILTRRMLRRRVGKAWKGFKAAAVSSFAFVETNGLLFGAKLVSDTAGLTRTVAHPATDGLTADVARRAGPELAPGWLAGRNTGFTPDDRIAMAEAVLRAMSLTEGFARLVLLAGHGSTTVNNPHASGLDCGACGGHTGEANARVAAAILNDPGVRDGLAARGIPVPADTWFVAGLHDTTTDEVVLYEVEGVPQSHAEDLRRLEARLGAASALARAKRAPLLGIEPGRNVDAKVFRRSQDWSQVRPEWGLAGNAAFIAAPRNRTRGLDLGGRVFLHSYDWRQDTGFRVLELIMTAPLVVASWINLQYYGSTVDNRAFGSGNKVLHNVVGTLGVLEGNAGDLRTGLPWQSVHDGRRLMHEPVRLSAFIEAPQTEIERVIAMHESVGHLVGNRWIHLFQIATDGSVNRYAGDGLWQPA